MEQGWVKLYRKIRLNLLYTEERMFSKFEAWIDLLLSASHKDTKVSQGSDVVECPKGSFVTSIRKLSDRWGWSKTKVVTFCERLEKEQMITFVPEERRTIISIVNWGVYQGGDDEKGQSKDSERTEKGRSSDDDRTEKSTIKNVENIDQEDIYTRIFRYWNAKGIIRHRLLDDKIKRKINGALKGFSEQEILNAIDNYARIVKDDRYYFSYKWTLKDFLSRGLDMFTDWDIASSNFLKDKNSRPKEVKPKWQPGSEIRRLQMEIERQTSKKVSSENVSQIP